MPQQTLIASDGFDMKCAKGQDGDLPWQTNNTVHVSSLRPVVMKLMANGCNLLARALGCAIHYSTEVAMS